MSLYSPEPVPYLPEELSAYLTREFAKLQVAINEISLQTYYAEPDNPYDGLTVLADGTNWNPNSGGGAYTYWNSGWVFLGQQAQADPHADQYIGDQILTLNSQTAGSVLTPQNGGFVFIMADSDSPNYPQIVDSIVFAYDTGASPTRSSVFTGSNAALTSGVLSDGSGTDGQVTYSTHGNGRIYVSNRQSSTRVFRFTFIGATGTI